jgi:tRNA-dihydrouridine synthase
MERAVDHMGPERGGRWMRKAYPWYVERMGGGKELQAAMQRAETIDEAREALYAAKAG